MLKTAIALVLLLIGSGCSTFDAPSAGVSGVTVTDVTGDAMTLSFTLDLGNPNEEPLELHELHYTLRVGNQVVYRGRRSPQATLASQGTRQLRVPAVITADRVPIHSGNDIPFHLTGRVGYLTPDRLSRVMRDLHIRRPKVRFEADGLVEAPGDPSP